MSKSKAVCAVMMMLAASTTNGQTTWYVDDDNCPGPGCGTQADPFCAIQAGIDAAVDGDEIEVAPGTYVERIDLLGKAITLRGTGGPAATVIDGNASGPVITCDSGEWLDTVIEGFTVTNGYARHGGGMRNYSSSPTLTNCTFSGNSANDDGGGMYNHQSSPTLTNCAFSGNSANYVGAGMYNYQSNPTLTDCTFSGNSATGTLGAGGGMYNYQSNPTLTNCTFNDNSANHYGGGMYNREESSPALTDCTFNDNSANHYGGGMYNSSGSSPALTDCTFNGNWAYRGGGMYNFSYCSPTLTNCTFSENSANYGGGMYNLAYDSPRLTNCTFSGNSADVGGGMYNDYESNPALTNCTFSGNSAVYGGGMSNYYSSPTLTNCTFSGNTTDSDGGGMYSYSGSSPTLTNCILWDDAPNELAGSGTTVVTYSDVQGGWGGEGNIDADPFFVDADGPDDTPGTEDDNLRLSPGSPCIDAGDPDFIPKPGAVDLDGHARVLCGRVDMGAYEFGIGDHDCDEDIDLTDFTNWAACMTGPDAGPYNEGCEAFDFNGDQDVDHADFSAFQRTFGGP